MITCSNCGKEIAPIDWGIHKQKHPEPEQLQLAIHKELVRQATKVTARFDRKMAAAGVDFEVSDEPFPPEQ